MHTDGTLHVKGGTKGHKGNAKFLRLTFDFNFDFDPDPDPDPDPELDNISCFFMSPILMKKVIDTIPTICAE